MTPPKRAPYSYAVSVGLVVLGMGYLALTGLYGEYGMMRLVSARAEAEVAERELRGLEAQQAELERDIRALSPDSLDLDALEERLRAVLGWAHRDDLLLPPETAEAPPPRFRPKGAQPALPPAGASPAGAPGTG